MSSKLIAGERIRVHSLPETAGAIARLADCFPFYIHHIVKALKQSGLTGSPESVEQVVQRQLLDANDPWELNHYRERIPVYYGKNKEQAVVGILDGIAVHPSPMSTNDLLAELKSTGALDDREKLLGLLRLVEQDHYLARNADGLYRFRFPLLRRWWLLSRGLQPA